MSLFSDSLSYAADTTAVQAGDLSFGTKAGAVVAGAMISGLGSIYNTAAAGANALGADVEQIDTAKTLGAIDSDWETYYKENQNAIDVAGFVATSLIPGTLAVKGLNAVRSGASIGAFGRALNFARTGQTAALERGLAELATEGGSVFTRINKNKLAVMGWETADQVLQAATFELAVALTMKQSPLLADDSWWDIGKGIATGAALGGVIGGGIGALGINKAFKDAVKAVDLESNKYRAVSGMEKLNLSEGDRAYGIIDSVLKLPQDLPGPGLPMKFKFPLGSGNFEATKDLRPYLTGVAKASTKAAMEEFEISLRKLASGAGEVGGASPAGAADVAEPMANFILGRYQKLKDAGAPPSQIADQLGDHLFNLKKVSAATDEPLYKSSDLVYFKKSISEEELKTVRGVSDLQELQTSNVPLGKGEQAYNKPYIFLGTPEQLAGEKLAIIGKGSVEDGIYPSLEAAWKSGANIAKTPDGALRINQTSGLWKRVEDPVFDSRRYLNTRTGAVTEDTVLTAADRLPAGKKLQIVGDTVTMDLATGRKVARMGEAFRADGSLDYITARHAWASTLEDSAVPRSIDAADISLLSRASKLSPEKKAEITIKDAEGNAHNGLYVDDILLRSKVEGIRDTFAAGEEDVREVAYRFAVPEAWLEKLVGSEFGSALRNIDELGKDSSRELSDFLSRENVVATYTKPQQFVNSVKEQREFILDQASYKGGQFVTGELAFAYRVNNAVRANQNASASVLGSDFFNQLPKLEQDAAKLADSIGAGATFLGAANANYGEVLRQTAEFVGKLTHGKIQEASDLVASTFASVGGKIQTNKKAAAELGIITNILRNDAGKFVELPTLDQAGNLSFVRRELANLINNPKKYAEKEAELIANGERVRIDVQDPDVMSFLRTHLGMNGTRVDKQTVLSNARGFQSNRDPAVLYAPPIDTNYFQHFAFVRPVDGKAFSTSEVSMVFGRNAEELSKRISLVDSTQFDVITKDAGERFHKAKGDYDFDQTINERNIDSALRRSGALSNFFPETRAENIVEDYLRWHQNQESKLIRNAVESNYSQQFEQLSAIGRQYTESATSKFSGTLKAAKSEINNPYEDYKKTFLDVSKRSEYTFFHQANEFIDALGTRAYQVLSDITGKANQNLLPWEEANAIAEKHGIRGLYQNEASYFTSNTPRDRNLIKETVAKANTLLANLVLRFDHAQAIMNVVSTPLLLGTELASIRTLVARDSELTGALNQLTSVAVPGGGGAAVPSTMKLLGNAVKNFFGENKKELLQRYKANGDIKDTLSLYHSAISDLQLSPNFKAFSDGTSKVADKIAGITGNNFAEQFTRFVSADVMRQITEPLVAAGKLELPAANAYISTFVNRVQGNYISSQRPVVFQGVLGGAIGLFQTYSFNLLQQLLRHVENKDSRAVATLFGMQSGLFGLNGTPMFDAINTHIIGNASINQGHYDAYSVAPGLLGKEMGDWLMYGTASAFPAFGDKWPALYSRGDINPRHMTILPMSVVDVPAVDASIRTVKNLADVGSKLLGGANITSTLLEGLEHNGINRPLAGLAQILAGQSTTSKGNLISANSDMELIASASRIAGAKPMDEAIALNNLYRLQSYRAADSDRMDALGEVVKTKLSRNQMPSDEEFMSFMKDYTKIGGRVENFNAKIQTWSKAANTSVVEGMRRNINSSTGQRLNEIMGGEPLPDWRNTASSDQAPQ